MIFVTVCLFSALSIVAGYRVQGKTKRYDSFAAIRNDGALIVWSAPSHVFTSYHIESISSTSSASAAVDITGSVITWGAAAGGADTTGVDLTHRYFASFLHRVSLRGIKNGRRGHYLG